MVKKNLILAKSKRFKPLRKEVVGPWQRFFRTVYFIHPLYTIYALSMLYLCFIYGVDTGEPRLWNGDDLGLAGILLGGFPAIA